MTDRPLRIAHVLTRFLQAGTEENTAITCNHQVASGHRVWVICGEGSSDDALAMLDPRVTVILVRSLKRAIDPVNDVVAVFAVARLLRREGVDLVHTHQSKGGAIGRAAALAAGVKAIVHGVHIAPFVGVGAVQSTVYRLVERMLAGATHAFIHVSPALRDAYLEAGIGAKGRHHVIASGMDLEAYRQAPPPADAAALVAPIPGGSGRPFVLLMVAALERRKRHAEFLPVFRRLVEQSPDVRLFLVGDGEERAALEAQVRELGLAAHVRFLGIRKDIGSLLALADVGLLASANEGLARVLMQYVCAGLPVVTTRLAGVEAVVRDGENGHLIPVDEMERFPAAILGLINDRDHRKRLAEGSRKVDLSAWSGAEMVRRIGEVYRLAPV